MEPETSQFESSEMLAAYLASTPLLDKSWRLCGGANAAVPQSFTVEREAEIGYVAFSGVQMVDCSEETCRQLVAIESYAAGIFGGFCGAIGGDREPIMVHGGLLQLFLMFYRTHNLQSKIFSTRGSG